MTSPRDEDLNTAGPEEEDGEGWMTSYLDVLTLLLTLFVLLLALSDRNISAQANAVSSDDIETTQRVSRAVVAPPNNEIEPENDGVLPKFDGVSISKSQAGLNLRIQDHLLFASGDAQLTEDGRAVLHRIVSLLEQAPGDISVEGHTDTVPIHTPRFPSNWELSSARATAVLRYLIDEGIAKQRLRAIGYAATRPLKIAGRQPSRAENRRVELVVHDNPRVRSRE